MAVAPWDRMLSMRIVSRQGRVILVSTPNGDAGLFLDFYLKGTDPKWSDYWSIKYSVEDNPHIPKEEIAKARERMTDLNAREQIDGEFVSRLGHVFEIHDNSFVSELPPEAESWPTFIGVRPAANNPFVCAFIKFDPRGKRYWVFDEIHDTRADAREVIKLAASKVKGHILRAKVTDYFQDTWRQDLGKMGMKCTYNDEKGIQRQQAEIMRVIMIQNLLSQKGDLPRLLFVRDKTEKIVEDFRNSKWPESREEAGRKDQEAPLDRNIGSAMAVSFVCAWLESRRGSNIYRSQLKD